VRHHVTRVYARVLHQVLRDAVSVRNFRDSPLLKHADDMAKLELLAAQARYA